MFDIKKIDLNLLVSLDVLLDLRNVSRSAERLGLTQSTMSSQLARLRRMLDDPLLLPAESGRGMTPTAYALRVAPRLKDVLRELEAAMAPRADFDAHRDSRVFRIAASDNAVGGIGLALAGHLCRGAGPGIRVAFHRPDTARIAEQMVSGEIDLLIGSPRMVPPSAKARVLVEDGFVHVQRHGHPRGTGPLDLESYCALRHVLVSTSGGSLHGYMDELLDAMGRRRAVVLSVEQFTLVPQLLHATDLVATVPRRLAQRHADVLDAFDLPFTAEGFTLSMAWHARNQADPAHQWLRGVLLALALAQKAPG
ncbi:LysR family transcriptional regulator [Ramlibacter sp.]|uniref:LysR family transcriptional regulator n=1 Tax=Ramlibacter sp. TaxID=1917967 RepID=UPI0025D2BF89|nr:LysR family transcriptional regulator [Ramlibacter sp.]